MDCSEQPSLLTSASLTVFPLPKSRHFLNFIALDSGLLRQRKPGSRGEDLDDPDNKNVFNFVTKRQTAIRAWSSLIARL